MTVRRTTLVAAPVAPCEITPAPDKWPTAFAAALRMCIFQPTTSPRECRHAVQTSYGRVVVKGCAGQCEAGLHDAMMYSNRVPDHPDAAGAVRYCALHPSDDPAPGSVPYRTSHGSPFIVAEVEQCRKLLAKHYGKRGRPITQSLERLCDLFVSLKTTGRDRAPLVARGHLFDDEVDRLECGRTFALVVLGAFDTSLLAGDVQRFFDPRPLAAMKYGATQAVARFLLSHDPARWAGQGVGYTLDTVLASVGIALGAALCKARHHVRAEAAALAALGFELTDDGHFRVDPDARDRAERWHWRHMPAPLPTAALPAA